jgi:hypothetical protein
MRLRLLLLFVMFFCACKYEGTSVGIGKGTIYGYVYLHDSIYGNDVNPRDFSGIRISIEDGSQQTTTDYDGQYSLKGIPDKKFSLSFSRPGFGMHKDVNHLFSPLTGTETEYYPTVRLYTIRKLTPNLVLRPFTSDTSSTRAIFSARVLDSQYFNNQGAYPSVKLYFGKTSSLSAFDPNSFQYQSEFVQISDGNNIATIPVYRDSLIANGFHSGENVYCVAFACGFLTQNEFYIDPATGKKIFTGLSPFHSEARNFSLP